MFSTRGIALIISTLVLLAISTLCFFLRVVAIYMRKRGWRSHDYFAGLSLFCLTGYVCDAIVGVAAGGYGAHVRTVPYNKLVISLKVFFASEWFWATSVASFRIAILLLYVDIFRKRVFFWAAVSTGLLVVLYWVASILTIALLCRPINVNWNRTTTGTCGDLRKTEFASAGFNMGIDLLVVLLPMPVVWTLQMSREKKFGVTAAFTLGMITAAVNLGRLIQTSICSSADLTYCAIDSSILVTAEMSSGILVACVPTLGPILFRTRARNLDPQPRRKMPTIGSLRNWSRRHRQSPDTLLESHDSEYDWDRSKSLTAVHEGANTGTGSTMHSVEAGEGLAPPAAAVLRGEGVGVRNESGVERGGGGYGVV
ncbi:hypothetical protein P168DRAFT_314083 [Aspergillus campestris IBT 28561]|uniref:Rhodopsin domain-containing protein n=1 Tax=Aspergillus campestris (strain IBT 28561) TaxID=1392248 RepID=A0A2I1DDJ2_ASPC2|nr:uncharacterized protein P168DRAFT_314083 [Aspergillus campestris IBT 28561]PKY07952.1 hypothetical protein P168DRAFT_314083 [Aspergillus campestris IBT 28561]